MPWTTCDRHRLKRYEKMSSNICEWLGCLQVSFLWFHMISHSWGIRYSVERPLVLKWPTDPAPWRTPVSCHRPANLECRVWHPKWYLPKVRFRPWKFNSKRPWKYTIPKRKVVFQPSFFTGRAVKLQECKTPLLQISQVWNLGNADSGIRYDSYFSYFVFGVSSCSRTFAAFVLVLGYRSGFFTGSMTILMDMLTCCRLCPRLCRFLGVKFAKLGQVLSKKHAPVREFGGCKLGQVGQVVVSVICLCGYWKVWQTEHQIEFKRTCNHWDLQNFFALNYRTSSKVLRSLTLPYMTHMTLISAELLTLPSVAEAPLQEPSSSADGNTTAETLPAATSTQAWPMRRCY